MSDTIFVSGLVLHAYHGVGDDEGRIGQQFLLDLALDLDLAEAARSDKLVDTISYADVIEVASKAFRAKRYRLVEAAAGAVADARAGALSRASRGCTRHGTQAARADRGGLRRCRRDARTRRAMAEALIGLGGNVGDVRATLERAIAAFCDGEAVRLLARSSDYRTPPGASPTSRLSSTLCIAVATDAYAAAPCWTARMAVEKAVRARPGNGDALGAAHRSTSTF